jgi:hypothetical protein
MTEGAGHLKTAILVIIGICLAHGLYAAHGTGTSRKIFYEGLPEKVAYSRSQVSFPETEYMFNPVVQGTLLSHTFLIRNDSPQALVIRKVNACNGKDCVVVVESRSGEILPGTTGAIRIQIYTDLIEGTGFANTLTLHTNHRKYPVSTIHISGTITRFATITPHRVTLAGSWKQEVKSTLLIIPGKGYPFRIKGIKARKGRQIGYDFQEIKKDGRPAYLISVRNVMRKRGSYRDILFIGTDSDVRPEIRIRVNGEISDEPPSGLHFP